jgi:hypothetical protein
MFSQFSKDSKLYKMVGTREMLPSVIEQFLKGRGYFDLSCVCKDGIQLGETWSCPAAEAQQSETV